jgi:hypothetical protein
LEDFVLSVFCPEEGDSIFLGNVVTFIFAKYTRHVPQTRILTFTAVKLETPDLDTRLHVFQITSIVERYEKLQKEQMKKNSGVAVINIIFLISERPYIGVLYDTGTGLLSTIVIKKPGLKMATHLHLVLKLNLRPVPSPCPSTM